jgi:hypothetical protein
MDDVEYAVTLGVDRGTKVGESFVEGVHGGASIPLARILPARPQFDDAWMTVG